jgi:hypothetical protein
MTGAMRLRRVARWAAGIRPTGLAIEEDRLVVAESGSATVSVYRGGERRRQTRLPDGVNPYMRFSLVGGTLLPAGSGAFYCWSALAEAVVYLVSDGEVCGRVRLGPYSLCDWAYSSSSAKLVVASLGERVLYFAPADLAGVRPRAFGYDVGALAMAPGGGLLYAADRLGEQVRVIEVSGEALREVLEIGPGISRDFPEAGGAAPFARAPIAISPDSSTLYLCPLRGDPAQQLSPLVCIDLRTRARRVISGRGIRFPYHVALSPTRDEAYVVGCDETVVVDLRFGRVTRALGPGKLTGFAVAPDGTWAAGTDAYHRNLYLFDLQRPESLKVPCSEVPEGEFVRTPVVIDPSSSRVAIPDPEANQVVEVEVRREGMKRLAAAQRGSQVDPAVTRRAVERPQERGASHGVHRHRRPQAGQPSIRHHSERGGA